MNVMNKGNFAIGMAVVVLAASAAAQTPPARRLGDHPAVVVKRLEAHRGYDYASKFYPHPAWLYLRAAPPDAELAAGAGSREARPEPAAATSGTASGDPPTARAE